MLFHFFSFWVHTVNDLKPYLQRHVDKENGSEINSSFTKECKNIDVMKIFFLSLKFSIVYFTPEMRVRCPALVYVGDPPNTPAGGLGDGGLVAWGKVRKRPAQKGDYKKRFDGKRKKK